MKWVDNLLSHRSLPGIVASRQGVQREISSDGVLAIELVKRMTEELGMTLDAAVEATRAALENHGASASGEYRTPSGIVLQFPIAELERSLRERLRDALEAVPRPRRGRPPRQKKNAGQ